MAARSASSASDANTARGLVRLNVNLNRETAEALKEIAEERGISATEAVRRAISIYKYIDDEVQDGRKVITSDQENKNVKELVLL